MKKYLKFRPRPQEYLRGWFDVLDKNDDHLGYIAPKGEVFKRRAVYTDDDIYPTEFTSECLRELADKLDEIEGKKSNV